jgi:glycerol-3-phosphate acyltransferase PlsY
VYRINIFEHGSLNMGATNVHRVLGFMPFLVTLILDIAKGTLGVLLAGGLASIPDEAMGLKLVGGLAAIGGHTLSFWVRFRGGKGVATGLGVFFGLTPVSSFCALILFLGVLLVTRYVSLGSMVGAAALPFLVRYWGEGGVEWNGRLAIIAGLTAGFIIFKHRANISRLIAGRETKIGQGAKKVRP